MYERVYKILSTKSWMRGWLETGLMFMDVNFLREIDFIAKYDWKYVSAGTYPELIIPQIVGAENIKLKYFIGDKNDYV